MAEPITRVLNTLDQLKTFDGLTRFAKGAVRSVPQGIADVADKAVNATTLGLIRPGFGDAMRQTLQDSPVASQGTAADAAGELAPALLGINAAGRAVRGMVAPSVRARYVTKDGVPFDVVRTPVRNEWARGTDYTAELPRTNDSPFAPTQIGYTRLRNKGQAPGPGTEQYLPQASDDLTVHPDYRRQGVATAMYDEAERWRQVRPATNLTEQGQEFWGNRDPEKVRTMLRAQFDQHVDNVRAGRVNPDFVHGFLDYHPDQYSAPGVNRLAVEEADRARKVLYKEGLLPPAVDYDTPPAMRGTPGVDHWTPALEAAQRRQALQGVLGLGTGGAPKPK